MANKFGIREVCDVKFYKYTNGVPASTPTFEIDTAKTSTVESATTTVYAQGGRGNARRMSWEGERTLTFTVEDALFSKASLEALMGESFSNGVIKVKDTSTAGMYKIEALTLIRDEDGTDKEATITINKAKLQSNLNFAFAPTGDPMAITFTFDAFPDDNGEFMSIECDHFKTTATANTVTKINVNNGYGVYSVSVTGADDIDITHNETSVKLKDSAVANLTITANDQLVCGSMILSNGESITLAAGSETTWYVI